MQLTPLLAMLAILIGTAYVLGRNRATKAVARTRDLHSLPGYYGAYALLWCGLPSLLLLSGWLMVEPSVVDHLLIADLPAQVQELPEDRLALYLTDVKNLATDNIVSRQVEPALEAAASHYRHLQSLGRTSRAVLVLGLGLLGLLFAWRRIHPQFQALNRVEKTVGLLLMGASTIAIFTTIGIVFSLIFETIRFFQLVPVTDFLFGLEWSPQTALRADQVGSSGRFGAIPLFAGTLLITFIAMLVAVPIGLLAAIYMAEFATPRFRRVGKPLLEILAGIPTVVYGFFAALTVAPMIRNVGESMGLDVASESALAAGLVMGVMIIPFVSSLSDDAITAVPRGLREASLGLGATKAETIQRVLFPAALPGIVGGILLAVSRAIGETMIVVMAAGLAANLTVNPLEAVTTVTVQIVTLLVGDQEFESAKTLAAFALGLMLFLVTLMLNIIALRVVRKYRQQYE